MDGGISPYGTNHFGELGHWSKHSEPGAPEVLPLQPQPGCPNVVSAHPQSWWS